jgi:transposase
MPAKLRLELTTQEVRDLEEIRDHASKPYLRERAAAILKIAQGGSGREVALHGLLKPHWQDTIYEWVARYRAKGKAGLEIKPGRGRKPAFSPSVFERRRG